MWWLRPAAPSVPGVIVIASRPFSCRQAKLLTGVRAFKRANGVPACPVVPRRSRFSRRRIGARPEWLASILARPSPCQCQSAQHLLPDRGAAG